MDIELNLTTETVEQTRLKDPLVVAPDVSVRDVFELLKAKQAGGLLICQDEKLQGVFTERDALRLMAADATSDGANLDRPISEVMTTEPATLTSSSTVAEAIKMMAGGGYRTLPILDESGKPVGLLSVKALVHYIVQHFPQSVYNLSPNPTPAMEQREGA